MGMDFFMLGLNGRNALIFGVASADSIAWGIAKKLHAAGMTIHLGYQQRFKSRILQLVKSEEIPIASYNRCDVTNPEELETFFAGANFSIDLLVHSIAFAEPQTFAKPISDVESGEFSTALEISAFSLLPLAKAAKSKMSAEASIIAMTYLGGQRVVANYKLMGIAKAALEATVRELSCDFGPSGIRVNAISAGPVKTLAPVSAFLGRSHAASQVTGFDNMLKVYQQVAPMRRLISQEDVGGLAAFLASPLSRNITGQTIFVDAGYSSLAMAELPG